MRILIAGRDLSDTSYVEDLRAIWSGHEIDAVSLSDFSAELLADHELLAVASPYDGDADIPLEPLSALTNIMLEPELPVLALGWGFEVACLAYGDDLPEVATKVEGAIRLVPTAKGETLFQGSDPLRVSAAMRWDVDELPRGLVVLARSETGIEAFQHKAKQLFALQQMPSDFVYPSDAKLVYQNLLSACSKRG